MALVYLNLEKCTSSQLLQRLILEQPALSPQFDMQTSNFPNFLLGWPLIIDERTSTRYYGDDAFEYILRIINSGTSNANELEDERSDEIPGSTGNTKPVNNTTARNLQMSEMQKTSSRELPPAGDDQPRLDHVSGSEASSPQHTIDSVIGEQDQFSSILQTYKIPM